MVKHFKMSVSLLFFTWPLILTNPTTHRLNFYYIFCSDSAWFNVVLIKWFCSHVLWYWIGCLLSQETNKISGGLKHYFSRTTSLFWTIMMVPKCLLQDLWCSATAHRTMFVQMYFVLLSSNLNLTQHEQSDAPSS